FFFSSRRRHTRSHRDWSSDVCSSDLRPGLDHVSPTALTVPTGPTAIAQPNSPESPTMNVDSSTFAPFHPRRRTNRSRSALNVGSIAFEVTGKSAEYVHPVTQAVPLASTTIAWP